MNKIEITVCRIVPARPADVYDAWLDRTRPGGPWFGPSKVVLDAREGGLFFHAVHHEGHDWAHYGRFLRLERPGLIEHTWVSEATRGCESVVTITLEAQGSGTLFTLKHAGVPDDEMGRQHRDGWEWAASALTQSFDARAKT